MIIFMKMVSVIILIPLSLLAFLLYSTMPYHNMILYSFSRDLFSIPVAPGDEIIEKRKEIGVLFGNGNHCDYYAGIAIKTSKQRSESIVRYYTEQYEGDSKLGVIDVRRHFANLSSDEMLIRSNLSILNNLKQAVSGLSVGEYLFVVYIFEHSMTGRFGDVRCT